MRPSSRPQNLASRPYWPRGLNISLVKVGIGNDFLSVLKLLPNFDQMLSTLNLHYQHNDCFSKTPGIRFQEYQRFYEDYWPS